MYNKSVGCKLSISLSPSLLNFINIEYTHAYIWPILRCLCKNYCYNENKHEWWKKISFLSQVQGLNFIFSSHSRSNSHSIHSIILFRVVFCRKEAIKSFQGYHFILWELEIFLHKNSCDLSRKKKTSKMIIYIFLSSLVLLPPPLPK